MSPDSWENPQLNAGYFGSPNNETISKGTILRTPQPAFRPDESKSTVPDIAQQNVHLPKNGNPPNQHDNHAELGGHHLSKFRPAGHALRQSESGQPLMTSPTMPNDIRLPDDLPASVFSVPKRSVLESSKPEPASLSPTDAKQQQDYLPGEEYPLDPTELQLDYSRMNQNPDQASGATRPNPDRPQRSLPTAFQPPPRLPEEAYYSGPYISQFANQPTLMEQSGAAAKLPNYRPDLGHRLPEATLRASDGNDYGQPFDFEKKHGEYPGLEEILATGKYFGSATLLYLRPAFQANTSIFHNLAGVTETFDFSYKMADQFQVGFESRLGPGIMFDYFGYHDFSSASQFTSDGIESGTSSAWMRGAHQWSRLTAANSGETLTARHRMEVDVIGASFFKEVKLPKARINGKFGFHTAHVIHELTAELQDSGGTEIGNLRARSDLRGFGPQFRLEYFRPIGHTKIEFLTCVGGSMLFGKQSQEIINSTGPDQTRLQADEFVTTFDYFAGAQYRKMWGENRCYFARAGMIYQVWSHGGTAVQPQDDFGFRGFSITAGINR